MSRTTATTEPVLTGNLLAVVLAALASEGVWVLKGPMDAFTNCATAPDALLDVVDLRRLAVMVGKASDGPAYTLSAYMLSFAGVLYERAPRATSFVPFCGTEASALRTIVDALATGDLLTAVVAAGATTTATCERS